MIELHLTASTATELRQLILGLAGFSSAPAGEMTAEIHDPRLAPADKPKATPRKTKEVAPAPAKENPPSATSAPEETPTPDAGSSASDTSTVEYADVQKAVTALAAAKGRDAAVAVLGEFGVGHGKDLKPEQWAEAVAQLAAALED